MKDLSKDGVSISPACSVPFSSPAIVPAGFKFCCLPHLPQWESLDFWNGPEMRAIRREFLDGGVPDLCRACIAVNRHLGQGPDGGPVEKVYAEEVPLNFRTLSLARSNTCNNACEMCRADLSTTFGREFGGYVKVANEIDLRPFVDEIEAVYIAGGNPVQDPGVLEILQFLDPKRVKFVMFTSNGTRFPTEYLEALSRFREVLICFSIDADHELNEQIRRYSQHERTYATIRDVLRAAPGNCRVAVQQTLTMHSYRRMYQLYKEVQSFLPIDELCYSPNPCVWPEHLSLTNLSSTDLLWIDNQLLLLGQEPTPFARDMCRQLQGLRSYIEEQAHVQRST